MNFRDYSHRENLADAQLKLKNLSSQTLGYSKKRNASRATISIQNKLNKI